MRQFKEASGSQRSTSGGPGTPSSEKFCDGSLTESTLPPLLSGPFFGVESPQAISWHYSSWSEFINGAIEDFDSQRPGRLGMGCMAEPGSALLVMKN